MAAADYYHCDLCGGKTFYDADIDWEVQHVGAIKCICERCAKTHAIILVKRDGEA